MFTFSKILYHKLKDQSKILINQVLHKKGIKIACCTKRKMYKLTLDGQIAKSVYVQRNSNRNYEKHG